MASATQIVREYILRDRSAEAARSIARNLNSVAQQTEKVAKSTMDMGRSGKQAAQGVKETAEAAAKSARATDSAARAFQKLESRIDGQIKASRQAAAALDTVERAANKGVASTERYAHAVTQLASQQKTAAQAAAVLADASRRGLVSDEQRVGAVERVARAQRTAAGAANAVNEAHKRGLITDRQKADMLNRLEREYKEAGAAAQGYARQAKASSGSGLAAPLNQARGQLAFAATAGVSAVAGFGLARVGAGFEQQMAVVQAVSMATDADLAELTATARDLGESTKFSAREAASGLEFLARAGFSTTQQIAAIPGVLDLAAASNIDLGRAADIASNVLSGFAKPAEQATKVADILALTTSRSNTNMSQLGDAMKYVAPISRTFGVSIEQTAASIGVLSDAGLQGSLAGTGLRRVITTLASPGKDLKALMGGLTVESDGLAAVLEKVKQNGITGAQAIEFFGDRGGPAFEVMAAGTEKIRALTGELETADGTAARMAATMNDTLTGAVKAAGSAFEGLQLTAFIGPLSDQLKAAFTDLAGALRSETAKSIADGLGRGLAAGVAGLRGLAGGVSRIIGEAMKAASAGFGEAGLALQGFDFSGLVASARAAMDQVMTVLSDGAALIGRVLGGAARPLAEIFGAVVAPLARLSFDGLTAGLKVLSAGLDVLGRHTDMASAAVAGLVAGFVSLKVGAAVSAVAGLASALGRGLVPAIRAVTLAMAANPIGLIAVGISASVAAIVYFRKEIAQAVAGVDDFGAAARAAFEVLGTRYVNYLQNVITVFRSLPDIAGAIFADLPVLAANAVHNIGVAFGKLPGLIGSAFLSGVEAVKLAFGAMWESAQSVVADIGRSLGGLGTAFTAALSGDFEGAGKALKDSLTAATDGAGDALKRFKDRLKELGAGGGEFVPITQGAERLNAVLAETGDKMLPVFQGLRAEIAATAQDYAKLNEQTAAFKAAITDIRDAAAAVEKGAGAGSAQVEALAAALSKIDATAAAAFKTAVSTAAIRDIESLGKALKAVDAQTADKVLTAVRRAVAGAGQSAAVAAKQFDDMGESITAVNTAAGETAGALAEATEDIEAQIAAMGELTRAYRVSDREGEVVAKTQDLLKQLGRENEAQARALAERWVEAQADLTKAQQGASKAVSTLGLDFEEMGQKAADVFGGLGRQIRDGTVDSLKDAKQYLRQEADSLWAQIQQAFLSPITVNLLPSLLGGVGGLFGLGGGGGFGGLGAPSQVLNIVAGQGGGIFDQISKIGGAIRGIREFKGVFGGEGLEGVGSDILYGVTNAVDGLLRRVGIGNGGTFAGPDGVLMTKFGPLGNFVNGLPGWAQTGMQGFGLGGLGGFGASLLGLGNDNALINTAASAVGGAIGNVLLPGIGGVLGGFAGSALSGLFNKKPTNAAAGLAFDPVSGRILATSTSGKPGASENLKLLEDVVTAVSGTAKQLSSLGVEFTEIVSGIDFGNRDETKFGIASSFTTYGSPGLSRIVGTGTVGDAEDLANDIMAELLKSAKGATQEVQAAIEASAGDPQALVDILGLIEEINALSGQVEPQNEYLNALKTIDQKVGDLSQRLTGAGEAADTLAEKLKKFEETASNKVIEGFNEQARDRLLRATDPVLADWDQMLRGHSQAAKQAQDLAEAARERGLPAVDVNAVLAANALDQSKYLAGLSAEDRARLDISADKLVTLTDKITATLSDLDAAFSAEEKAREDNIAAIRASAEAYIAVSRTLLDTAAAQRDQYNPLPLADRQRELQAEFDRLYQDAVVNRNLASFDRLSQVGTQVLDIARQDNASSTDFFAVYNDINSRTAAAGRLAEQLGITADARATAETQSLQLLKDIRAGIFGPTPDTALLAQMVAELGPTGTVATLISRWFDLSAELTGVPAPSPADVTPGLAEAAISRALSDATARALSLVAPPAPANDAGTEGVYTPQIVPVQPPPPEVISPYVPGGAGEASPATDATPVAPPVSTGGESELAANLVRALAALSKADREVLERIVAAIEDLPVEIARQLNSSTKRATG